MIDSDTYSIFWVISGILWSLLLLISLADGFGSAEVVFLILAVGSYLLSVWFVSGHTLFGEKRQSLRPAKDPYLEFLFPDQFGKEKKGE